MNKRTTRFIITVVLIFVSTTILSSCKKNIETNSECNNCPENSYCLADTCHCNAGYIDRDTYCEDGRRLFYGTYTGIVKERDSIIHSDWRLLLSEYPITFEYDIYKMYMTILNGNDEFFIKDAVVTREPYGDLKMEIHSSGTDSVFLGGGKLYIDSAALHIELVVYTALTYTYEFENMKRE